VGKAEIREDNEGEGGKGERGETYKIKMICLQGIFPLPASGQSQVGVGPIWIVYHELFLFAAIAGGI